MPDLIRLREAILKGDAKEAKAVTWEAIEQNADPKELVTQYMIPAMDEVGRRFECESLKCCSRLAP